MRRNPELARRTADFAIPWGVGVFMSMIAVDEFAGPDENPPLLAITMGLAIAQGWILTKRRERPELVLGVVFACGLAFELLIPETVLPIAGFFALYALAAARPVRVSAIGLAAILAIAATNFFTGRLDDTIFALAMVVTAWALGEASRSRRLAIEEAAHGAVADEQARIARELHDVIAHSVSVIVVQAAAADDVFERDPGRAREALRSIERSGREAMAELRRLLGAVKADGPTAPQPALEDLDRLAGPIRAGGLEVAVEYRGTPRPLPAGVEVSAYRIVQEALTNTVRHSGATRARVEVAYGDEDLGLEIVDDGRGFAGGDAAGHGLVGMRERAALLGGNLEAGPAPGGGFRVRARLPVGGAR